MYVENNSSSTQCDRIHDAVNLSSMNTPATENIHYTHNTNEGEHAREGVSLLSSSSEEQSSRSGLRSPRTPSTTTETITTIESNSTPSVSTNNNDMHAFTKGGVHKYHNHAIEEVRKNRQNSNFQHRTSQFHNNGKNINPKIVSPIETGHTNDSRDSLPFKHNFEGKPHYGHTYNVSNRNERIDKCDTDTFRNNNNNSNGSKTHRSRFNDKLSWRNATDFSYRSNSQLQQDQKIITDKPHPVNNMNCQENKPIKHLHTFRNMSNQSTYEGAGSNRIKSTNTNHQNNKDILTSNNPSQHNVSMLYSTTRNDYYHSGKNIYGHGHGHSSQKYNSKYHYDNTNRCNRLIYYQLKDWLNSRTLQVMMDYKKQQENRDNNYTLVDSTDGKKKNLYTLSNSHSHVAIHLLEIIHLPQPFEPLNDFFGKLQKSVYQLSSTNRYHSNATQNINYSDVNWAPPPPPFPFQGQTQAHTQHAGVNYNMPVYISGNGGYYLTQYDSNFPPYQSQSGSFYMNQYPIEGNVYDDQSVASHLTTYTPAPTAAPVKNHHTRTIVNNNFADYGDTSNYYEVLNPAQAQAQTQFSINKHHNHIPSSPNNLGDGIPTDEMEYPYRHDITRTKIITNIHNHNIEQESILNDVHSSVNCSQMTADVMKNINHLNMLDAELAMFRTQVCEQHRNGNCHNSDRCPHSHCQTWQRRNPKEYMYSAKLCPDIEFVKKGNKMTLLRRCSRGRGCMFAHSKEEELYHPTMYKTKMCSSHPNCSRYFCPFAHCWEELNIRLNGKLAVSDKTESKVQFNFFIKKSNGYTDSKLNGSKNTFSLKGKNQSKSYDKSKKKLNQRCPCSPTSSSTTASSIHSPLKLTLSPESTDTANANTNANSSGNANSNSSGNANSNSSGNANMSPHNESLTCNSTSSSSYPDGLSHQIKEHSHNNQDSIAYDETISYFNDESNRNLNHNNISNLDNILHNELKFHDSNGYGQFNWKSHYSNVNSNQSEVDKDIEKKSIFFYNTFNTLLESNNALRRLNISQKSVIKSPNEINTVIKQNVFDPNALYGVGSEDMTNNQIANHISSNFLSDVEYMKTRSSLDVIESTNNDSSLFSSHEYLYSNLLYRHNDLNDSNELEDANTTTNILQAQFKDHHHNSSNSNNNDHRITNQDSQDHMFSLVNSMNRRLPSFEDNNLTKSDMLTHHALDTTKSPDLSFVTTDYEGQFDKVYRNKDCMILNFSDKILTTSPTIFSTINETYSIGSTHKKYDSPEIQNDFQTLIERYLEPEHSLKSLFNSVDFDQKLSKSLDYHNDNTMKLMRNRDGSSSYVNYTQPTSNVAIGDDNDTVDTQNVLTLLPPYGLLNNPKSIFYETTLCRPNDQLNEKSSDLTHKYIETNSISDITFNTNSLEPELNSSIDHHSTLKSFQQFNNNIDQQSTLIGIPDSFNDKSNTQLNFNTHQSPHMYTHSLASDTMSPACNNPFLKSNFFLMNSSSAQQNPDLLYHYDDNTLSYLLSSLSSSCSFFTKDNLNAHTDSLSKDDISDGILDSKPSNEFNSINSNKILNDSNQLSPYSNHSFSDLVYLNQINTSFDHLLNQSSTHHFYDPCYFTHINSIDTIDTSYTNSPYPKCHDLEHFSSSYHNYQDSSNLQFSDSNLETIDISAYKNDGLYYSYSTQSNNEVVKQEDNHYNHTRDFVLDTLVNDKSSLMVYDLNHQMTHNDVLNDSLLEQTLENHNNNNNINHSESKSQIGSLTHNVNVSTIKESIDQNEQDNLIGISQNNSVNLKPNHSGQQPYTNLCNQVKLPHLKDADIPSNINDFDTVPSDVFSFSCSSINQFSKNLHDFSSSHIKEQQNHSTHTDGFEVQSMKDIQYNLKDNHQLGMKPFNKLFMIDEFYPLMYNSKDYILSDLSSSATLDDNTKKSWYRSYPLSQCFHHSNTYNTSHSYNTMPSLKNWHQSS